PARPRKWPYATTRPPTTTRLSGEAGAQAPAGRIERSTSGGMHAYHGTRSRRDVHRDGRRKHHLRSRARPLLLRLLVPVPRQPRPRLGAPRTRGGLPLHLAPPPRPLRPPT